MPKIVNSFTTDTGLRSRGIGDVCTTYWYMDLYVVENDIVYNMYVVHDE